MNASPFHAGEVAMQRDAGVAERMREVGPRVIRDHMPAQHREFFEQLPMLLVGSVDAQQRPWASALAGLPGFLHTPDARHLRIDALPAEGDPLRAALRLGATLGLLGIEPPTRRRNRMNGVVVRLDEAGFEVEVVQSFGNCPKYIQARMPQWQGWSAEAPAVRRESARLSDDAAALVVQADTLFIASTAPGQGADVSHRGGRPGFVRVDRHAGGTTLTLPDFIGNFFFNTLGNLRAHPHAGLLFVDHASGGVLQLTGRAQIVVDGAELARFDGAQRLLRIEVGEGHWSPQALPFRWGAPQPANELLRTGTWPG